MGLPGLASLGLPPLHTPYLSLRPPPHFPTFLHTFPLSGSQESECLVEEAFRLWNTTICSLPEVPPPMLELLPHLGALMTRGKVRGGTRDGGACEPGQVMLWPSLCHTSTNHLPTPRLRTMLPSSPSSSPACCQVYCPTLQPTPPPLRTMLPSSPSSSPTYCLAYCPTLQTTPPSSQDNAAVFPIIESYLLLGAAAALTPLSAAIQVWEQYNWQCLGVWGYNGQHSGRQLHAYVGSKVGRGLGVWGITGDASDPYPSC